MQMTEKKVHLLVDQKVHQLDLLLVDRRAR